MAGEIRVPTLGESVVDATVASWYKHEGEAVKRGEALVELETDKVSVEVSAQQDGVLRSIARHEGDVVAVDEVLGTIEAVGEQQASSDTPVEQRVSPEAQPATVQATIGETNGRQSPPPAPATEGAGRQVSPLARKIAADYNVDLAQITSANAHGRVTREDVISHLEQRQGQPAPQKPAESSPQPAPVAPQASAQSASLVIETRGPRQEERIHMSRRRQTIARRLVEAQHTAAMLTTFN